MSLEQHVIVAGLGFGDEGKGSTIDALSSKEDFDLVVRFNGGQQAGHNVINKGRHHTFTQFGAGFFNGVPSHTSRFCTFDPLTFNREAAGLSVFTDVDPYSLHTVSPRALLTTPLHVMANHEMEARNGHGTVGVGFGETIRYSLEADFMVPLVRDLRDVKELSRTMYRYRTWLREQGLLQYDVDVDSMVGDLMRFGSQVRLAEDDDVMDLDNKRVLFEGAQGVLLDQWHGFHPHTTWSNTTQANALELLGSKKSTVVGVTRTYHTRHGAGPLHGEGLFPEAPKELHNGDDGFQGAWRTAGFNVTLFDYAMKIVMPDYLSVTHVDVEAPVLASSSSDLSPLGVEWKDPHAREDVMEEMWRRAFKKPLFHRPQWTPMEIAQHFRDVLLWSDGPNDTDRKWEL